MRVGSELEAEALLIEGGRSERSSFEPGHEPSRCPTDTLAANHTTELLERFHLMGLSGLIAIAKCDAADVFLTRRHTCGTCLLSIGKRDPAGVKAEELGKQHKALPRVAASLIQVAAHRTYERNVVAHVMKRPVVRKSAVECPGVIATELYRKLESFVQRGNLALKEIDGIRLDGTIGKTAHSVAHREQTHEITAIELGDALIELAD